MTHGCAEPVRDEDRAALAAVLSNAALECSAIVDVHFISGNKYQLCLIIQIDLNNEIFFIVLLGGSRLYC